jgi:23S rRNA (guanosine2251-2'-O)-methyltransferase
MAADSKENHKVARPRPSGSTEVLYGFHPVFHCLDAHRRDVFELVIEAGKESARKEQMLDLATGRGVPVRQVRAKTIEQMAGSVHHQGVVARVSPYPLTDMGEILSKAGADDKPLFVLLMDQLTDTNNLGAMARTALCVGIHGIILPRDRSVQPTPAVSKASAGALEHIRLARVTNLSRTIASLKESGAWVAGLDHTARQTLYSADLAGPLALVVGGEGKGIRPLVKKQCDYLVRIPQQGPVNSLNASAAGAVAMYEIYRQRQLGSGGSH